MVNRKFPLIGRALLPIGGFFNTLVARKIFGENAGTELFIIPCVIIAALAFRGREVYLAIFLFGVALAIYAAGHEAFGEPLAMLDRSQLTTLTWLNSTCVLSLTFLIGLIFSNAFYKFRAPDIAVLCA